MSEKQEKPPERYWPFDGLGNVIRKDKLVMLRVPEQSIVVRVVDVQPAGFIGTPDGNAMPMSGSVTLAVQIPFQPKAGLPMVITLETPETSTVKLQ